MISGGGTEQIGPGSLETQSQQQPAYTVRREQLLQRINLVLDQGLLLGAIGPAISGYLVGSVMTKMEDGAI